MLAEDIHGWDELKEAAEEFGFEPTEDMPTVYELQERAKSLPKISVSTGTTNQMRFPDIIEKHKKTLDSDTLLELEKYGGLVLKYANGCDYYKLLGNFADTYNKATLLQEGFEHLGKDVEEEVREIMDALEIDIVNTLVGKCSCKKAGYVPI